MEFNARDQDIVRLLTKLKDVQGEYPEHIFAAQRQSFLKRITEIEVGTSGGTASGNSAGNIKPSIAASATSTLLEAALIITVIAETGVMAYFYRDKLADFFQPFMTGTRVEEVTPAPVIPTSLEIQGIPPATATSAMTVEETPSLAVEASPLNLTEMPTNTPAPGMMGNNSSTTPGVASTAASNGNNGHHYGQTPKPERTKENNVNNDKPPKDKEDKPPKDTKDESPKDKPSEGNNDKPPKDNDQAPEENDNQPSEDKPPKTK